MSRLTVSLACGRYDRTAPLLDGTVAIDGCDVIPHETVPEETFFRAFRNGEFDIAELSFSTYLLAVSRGNSAYIAVPAFPSRSFRHNAIYVRTDGPVRAAEDLKGRRIGLPEYQLTAHVWVRAFLADDFGLDARDIEWVTGGVEEAGRHEKVELDLPATIKVTHAEDSKTLSGMLLAGEIDALICPRAPRAYAMGGGAMRRLFDDSRQASTDYYRCHGIFPIMHVVGVRRTLADRHPWLPGSVFKAFAQAKTLAMSRLTDTTALSVSLPWLIEELDWTRAVIGDDFWSYGIERNRKTLDAFLDHHHRQGLSRKLGIEDVFHANTIEQFKI